MRGCPKKRYGSGNPSNRVQSSSVAPPKRAAPKGGNSGTGMGKTASMQSLDAKNKRTLQMLSRYDKSLYS